MQKENYESRKNISIHKRKIYTNPSYLWVKYPFYAALKHLNGKWYGIIMNVSKKNLGFQEDREIDILVVKCDPYLIPDLIKEKGFFPAYHMNKKNWITILLDGSVTKKKIKELLDLSYDLVDFSAKK